MPKAAKAGAKRRRKAAKHKPPRAAAPASRKSTGGRPPRAARGPLVDVARHDSELRRLISFIDLADGFTLAFAGCNFQPLRDALIKDVSRRSADLPVHVSVIDVSDLDEGGSPPAEIAARTAADSATGAKRALMITGLDSHVSVMDEGPALFASLNLARDGVAELLPHPTVIWLSDYSLTSLSRVAPDLWSWRSATFHFIASREVGGETIQEAFPGGLRMLDSEVEDVEKRIRALESVLQEYLPSIGGTPPERERASLAVLNELATGYLGLGNAKQASVSWRRMLDVARHVGDRKAESQARGNLGLAQAALGNLHGATSHFEKALAISRQIGDSREEGTGLLNLANSYLLLGDVHGAADLYLQALVAFRACDDVRGGSGVLAGLGAVWQLVRQPAKAVECLERALALSRNSRDRRTEARATAGLGAAYAAMDRPVEAIEYYEKALAIARDMGDSATESGVLGDLGNTQRHLGDVLRARHYIEAGLRLALQTEDRLAIGRLTNQLAAVLSDSGEPGTAACLAAFAVVCLKKAGLRGGQDVARDVARYCEADNQSALRGSLKEAPAVVAEVFRKLAGETGARMAKEYRISVRDIEAALDRAGPVAAPGS